MGRIYDVLNGLETHDLVRSQTASRPQKYAAVEPRTALDRLLEEKREELAEAERQYEAVVEELAEQLESGPIEEAFWTASVGTEETIDLLVERLSTADERLVVVGSAPDNYDVRAAADRIVDGIEDALERGVEVFMLLPPSFYDEIPTEVGREYEQRLRAHEEFHVRASERVSSTFEIIDESEVCIEVPHPLGGSTFAAIAVRDREFAAGVYEEFEPRWEEAEPPDSS
jgi:sugar-specific transcriptional regulator TrmB